MRKTKLIIFCRFDFVVYMFCKLWRWSNIKFCIHDPDIPQRTKQKRVKNKLSIDTYISDFVLDFAVFL